MIFHFSYLLWYLFISTRTRPLIKKQKEIYLNIYLYTTSQAASHRERNEKIFSQLVRKTGRLFIHQHKRNARKIEISDIFQLCIFLYFATDDFTSF